MPAAEIEFNLYDYFLNDDRLRSFAGRTAIEFNNQKLTYDRLRGLTDSWAERISAEGVREGDRVVLLLFDSPDFIACFLATALLGAICVPISTFLGPQDIAFVLSDCGARLVIAEHELAEKYSDQLQCPGLKRIPLTTAAHAYDNLEPVTRRVVRAATTTSSPCFILYTSGSTGKPKGVLHTHGAIPRTVANYSESVLQLNPEDRVYSSSRLFFAYGLGNSLSFPLAAGATVILDSGRPTPDRIADILAAQSPSLFFGVPAVYNALLEFHSRGGALNTSSIRLCVSAGEALPARIYQDWAGLFDLTILDGIGSTEMLHIFISNRQGEARAGSSGKAVRGYDLRLTTADGGSPVPGEPANLWVRGDSAFAGYWGRPEVTKETIRDGWIRTGDLYRTDDGGYFYHVGRSDDCFKVRGLWVSPVEVESALLADERIAEAAVVPAVDEVGLATVGAYVVIRSGKANEDLKQELISVVSHRLPQYKVPSQITFLDDLPRTSTGKVQRFRLRNRQSEGESL
jgi:benzoate-CoA ligase